MLLMYILEKRLEIIVFNVFYIECMHFISTSSIDVWFVTIGQYLAKIQLDKILKPEGA